MKLLAMLEQAEGFVVEKRNTWRWACAVAGALAFLCQAYLSHW